MNLSPRTRNRTQGSLTERAGKLSLPVNRSVKGKAVCSGVSELEIALSSLDGQQGETLPATHTPQQKGE